MTLTLRIAGPSQTSASTHWTLRLVACAVISAGAADHATAQAFQTFWVAEGAGNWMVSTNWSSGLPNASTHAQINNGGTARLFDPGAAASFFTLGSGSGNSGALEVLGGRAVVTFTYVGFSGEGMLSVQNGGVFSASLGHVIAATAGSVGDVTVDGAGSELFAGQWIIGGAGTGTFSASNGASIHSNFTTIGESDSGHGIATISGPGSRWTNPNDVHIGNGATGELYIQGGAEVTNNNGNIGVVTESNGTVAVTGPGSKWTNGVIAVGINGSGEMTISDGGVVMGTNGRIGRESNSSGAVTIDGPGSQWNCTGALTVGVASGVSPSSALLTLLNGGAVSANGGLTVHVGGKLQGDGVVSANVSNLWQVAPRGVLQVIGNYTEHPILGQLEIELASAESIGKLAVSGTAALGGVLRVKLLDGYVPLAGASFDVLDWGSLSGAFSTLSMPPLPAPLSWDTSQLYTDGVLSVTSPYLAADFDENGIVNGADLANWKTGFGTAAAATHMQGDADFDGDVDGADFLTWQLQLGSAPAIAATATVPEPTSCLLLVAAFVLFAAIARSI
jgi:T5SS/PEP-CTERM-associated repeat protein